MSWNTVPEEEIPLRLRLPKISTATRTKLIEWAQRQPAAVPWCLKRSAAYYDAAPPREMMTGAWLDAFSIYDATAALDLLAWQSQQTDKGAVDRLAMFDEVAGEGVDE